MTALWATILAASVACYGLKLAGLSLPESVIGHPRVQRVAGLLPIAMLSALVASDLFSSDRRYAASAPALVGVGAGGIALWRGRSLITVFLVAIIVTGLLRAIT